jgi:hypothetical protein
MDRLRIKGFSVCWGSSAIVFLPDMVTESALAGEGGHAKHANAGDDN